MILYIRTAQKWLFDVTLCICKLSDARQYTNSDHYHKFLVFSLVIKKDPNTGEAQNNLINVVVKACIVIAF